MEGGAVGHNFEMGLPKDYPCQVWFNLVQRFQNIKKEYKFLQLSIAALLSIKMSSNFSCSYMTMSRLTNILGFSQNIKICLICIISINRLKEKIHGKTQNIC
jgi:hypothetical protein